WKQASALDADLLMLGALPAELRGSQQLSLLIDDQRTRLLNGQSPSPQQAMEQARRGSRDGDPAVTEVAVTAQAPFAAIIGMQSPHHAQRSIVSLAASNA
ncbi:cellulose biosynthesis cyclic di-GMP-binding regulatory protein BcsB, partial [Listeria seeligeri]